MIVKLSDLKDWLQEGLNANGKIKFDIGVNVKDFQKVAAMPLNTEKPVRGVLRTLTGRMKPIKNFTNYTQVLVLELIVPQEKFPAVSDILDNYISLTVGDTKNFSDLTLIVNFDFPTVGVASNSIVGSGVPVQVIANFNFVQAVLYSNEVDISIDGQSLLFYAATPTIERQLTARNYLNDINIRNTPTSQSLGFVVVCPLLRTGIIKTLQNDFMQSASTSAGAVVAKNLVTKKYVLNYNDGITSRSYNVILSNAQAPFEKGSEAQIVFTFSQAV